MSSETGIPHEGPTQIMADLQSGTAGEPAAEAPESASVFDTARAELESMAADAPATTATEPRTSPAEAAAATTKATDDEDDDDDDEPSTPEPPTSRRKANQQLREQIKAELQQEWQQSAAQAEAQRQAEQQQRDEAQARQDAEQHVNKLIAGAKAGDYEASVALASLLEANKATAEQREQLMREVQPQITAAAESSRVELLNAISQDFQRVALDGIDVAQLRTAPSIQELVSRTYTLAREPLQQQLTASEQQVAALQAQVTGLQGRVAGRGPSPEPATGARLGSHQSQEKGIAGLFAEAAAEHNYAMPR